MTFNRFCTVLLPAVMCLCLFISPVSAQQQELDIEYAEHARLSTESLLMDITALPGGGFVAVGERGHVVVSPDGKDWKQAEVVPTRSTLTSITVSGGRLWAAGHDSVILTSGDGGLNWTRQYFDPDRQQPIMDVHFLDATHGLAIGAYGLALFTTDGGFNWQERVINDEEWHNNAILVLSETDMLIAGEAGFSYRSRDTGESWETIEMPYPGSMFGIVDGVDACVTVFGLRGHVQESCDSGDTWIELETGTESSIAGAVHVEGKTIMVGNSGLVLTREGSDPFKVEYHSSGMDFAAIVADRQGRFLLVGEDGVHHFPEQAEAGQ
jgi:photosystem II stability/assembly factor-like uncharacterized protein